MALGLYGVLTIVGVALLIAPTITAIMASFFGTAALVPVWALFLMLSSASGLISALLAPRLNRPRRALRTEAISVLVAGLMVACYVLALIAWPKLSIMTLIIWAGISGVCIWRSCQVFRELRLIKLAHRRNLTATQETLADPRRDK